jgi:hypothetical protein
MRRSTFLLAIVLVGVILATTLGAGASGAGVQAFGSHEFKVNKDQFVAAGSFDFDPIVKSGNFIIGVMDCVAIGTNVKLVVISKCYIVASTGQTFAANAKSSKQGVVVIAKQLLGVPAVNLTQCITTTAYFKDGTSHTLHLASAPRGEPVLPCKLG